MIEELVLVDVADQVACAWIALSSGLTPHITLRLTSPQAAIDPSKALSIAFIVALRFDLMRPCNCTVCRVVRRIVVLP